MRGLFARRSFARRAETAVSAVCVNDRIPLVLRAKGSPQTAPLSLLFVGDDFRLFLPRFTVAPRELKSYFWNG
jgi:hypothetical protein